MTFIPRLGPMYPIMLNHSTLILPKWLLTPSVGWIAGAGMLSRFTYFVKQSPTFDVGQAGSAVLPFLTGILASKFGITSLQPLWVQRLSWEPIAYFCRAIVSFRWCLRYWFCGQWSLALRRVLNDFKLLRVLGEISVNLWYYRLFRDISSLLREGAIHRSVDYKRARATAAGNRWYQAVPLWTSVLHATQFPSRSFRSPFLSQCLPVAHPQACT